MKISGINGVNTQSSGMNMVQANDSVSKSIQKQISNAQKALQELSSNKEMGVEEKMKRRQEIQKQITELNNQLRQHQIEQRKEQQAKKTSMDDMLGGTRRTAHKGGNQGVGLSQTSMKAMMSADSAREQAQVQSSVATKMEGRAGILESEIKLDSARGGDVEKKQEELAEVEQKVAKVQSEQMNTLEEANKELEAAAKADQQAEKTDSKDKKTDKKDNADNEVDDKSVKSIDDREDIEFVKESVLVEVMETEDVFIEKMGEYEHVDVLV